MNDRLLQERNSNESSSDSALSPPSTSSISTEVSRVKSHRRGLNVSGPVQPYHPSLKNFWYPVAFSSDLKEDTMVSKSL